MMVFINIFDIEEKNKIKGVLLIGALHTISDEFHQMFSEDRTPAIREYTNTGILINDIDILIRYK